MDMGVIYFIVYSKNQGVNDSELTPLQRLSIVGTSGMGALCYIPETYIGEEKFSSDTRLPSANGIGHTVREIV